KDPIRHKYGPISMIGMARDPDTGMLAARQMVMRFDPEKPIVWYFDKGFPEKYKGFFNDPGGIRDQTNEILANSGAKARVDFRNFDHPGGLTESQKGRGGREFGDARYSFIRWMSDKDMQEGYAGVTQFTVDPRTGETLSSSIVINDFAIKDYYVQRIDAYLAM